ncbi:gap junction alpha-9 protein [Genypterus blacodes]|uniref:gap junction alpha-9 protein n=1 Tax=Genypterus blacodes TaxID=154954 RepID=UPI003F757971
MTRGDPNHHRQSVYAAASHNGRVKMGDWNFLGGILEEVHIHSTVVGKIWLTILFIFRMLVLGVAAEEVWNDEQNDFVCNTDQPGCKTVCYDLAFPISLIRYWVLQVIFVSSPSLVYMGHALYRLRSLEKLRQRKKALLRRELDVVDVEMVDTRKRIEREMKELDQKRVNKVPLRGSLLHTYIAHIVSRSVVEVAFMAGQYLLYGFRLHPLFKCERDPCPNMVDCYVSRPTEKSVFMVFMQSIAAVSLFLNILEIMHLGCKNIRRSLLDNYPHLRRDGNELDDYYAGKKESIVHVSAGGTRKATIASAPSDYNLLLERTQGTDLYFSPAAPSMFLPLQDLNESRGSAQTPLGDKYTSSTTEPLWPPGDSTSGPKREAGDFSQHPLQGKEDRNETGSPDSPKGTKRTAQASSLPTLPVSMARRPWRGHGSFHCSTVLEGKSSDTDSYGCTQTGQLPVQTASGSDDKQHGRLSTPESLDDSSSGSRHHPRPPSSTCKVSVTSNASSKRAPDLQI